MWKETRSCSTQRTWRHFLGPPPEPRRIDEVLFRLFQDISVLSSYKNCNVNVYCIALFLQLLLTCWKMRRSVSEKCCWLSVTKRYKTCTSLLTVGSECVNRSDKWPFLQSYQYQHLRSKWCSAWGILPEISIGHKLSFVWNDCKDKLLITLNNHTWQLFKFKPCLSFEIPIRHVQINHKDHVMSFASRS